MITQKCSFVGPTGKTQSHLGCPKNLSSSAVLIAHTTLVIELVNLGCFRNFLRLVSCLLPESKVAFLQDNMFLLGVVATQASTLAVYRDLSLLCVFAGDYFLFSVLDLVL